MELRIQLETMTGKENYAEMKVQGQDTPQSGRVSEVSCGIILKSGIVVLPQFLDPSILLKITSHKEDFHLIGRREMGT